MGDVDHKTNSLGKDYYYINILNTDDEAYYSCERTINLFI